MDKKQKRNLLICISVIAVLLAFRMATDNSTVRMDLTDHLFTVSWEGYETVMDLNEVLDIDLLPLAELGTCLDGFEDKSLACGIWENTQWGEYHLYSHKGIEACIVIRTADQTVAFNYESEQATRSFFEALREYYTAQTWVITST